MFLVGFNYKTRLVFIRNCDIHRDSPFRTWFFTVDKTDTLIEALQTAARCDPAEAEQIVGQID